MTMRKHQPRSTRRDLAIWALLVAAYYAFPDTVAKIAMLSVGLLWLLSGALVLVIVLLYFIDFGRPK
ncbi:hypothetical protein [Methylococcus sp. EFPC2]|uniref:hypothetical protein n=1 Tax=Methylococcus sp. EFPC2 TaxID=2812648 RepID=UPI00196766C2|nr:hypothetical protein [Methylococcus sp. EFPC2]QSA97510.1 hypothetical protein JWZ97_01280 [Methylococcus sp. EFPC2]